MCSDSLPTVDVLIYSSTKGYFHYSYGHILCANFGPPLTQIFETTSWIELYLERITSHFTHITDRS